MNRHSLLTLADAYCIMIIAYNLIIINSKKLLPFSFTFDMVLDKNIILYWR